MKSKLNCIVSQCVVFKKEKKIDQIRTQAMKLLRSSPNRSFRIPCKDITELVYSTSLSVVLG